MDPKIGKAIFIYMILSICVLCITYQIMDMCGCFNRCKDHNGNYLTCTCTCPCKRKKPQQIIVVQAEEVQFP